MSKNHIIQIRVSTTQFDQILGNAQAKGYKTISDFVRMSILSLDTAMERKIHRIFEAVVEKKEEPRPAEDHCLLKFIEV
ncbi:MAG: hypothetical protein V1735_07155 [Nanoarchaeota archaeon]